MGYFFKMKWWWMMRKMFEKFPEVLLIDATYKQIKLRLPDIFPWNRFLNRICIPALSLSGNPNFSLLLPNPGNRSQCLFCIYIHVQGRIQDFKLGGGGGNRNKPLWLHWQNYPSLPIRHHLSSFRVPWRLNF